MIILFEIMKGLFFLLSLIAAPLVLRGSVLLPQEVSRIATVIVIPGYLVLCGIMLAYMWIQLWKMSHEDDIPSTGVLIKTFVVGLILGGIMATIYVLI